MTNLEFPDSRIGANFALEPELIELGANLHQMGSGKDLSEEEGCIYSTMA